MIYVDCHADSFVRSKDDAPAKDVSAAPPMVTKTVQTVEVRESPGQEAVLKPTKVVHLIPADQVKSQPKQD
ncbi:hypothetical protein ABZP36_034792 [Zizania latifolia]